MDTLQSKEDLGILMSLLLGLSFACMAVGFALASSFESTNLREAAVLALLGSIVPAYAATTAKLSFRSKILGSLFSAYYMAALTILLHFGINSEFYPVMAVSMFGLHLMYVPAGFAAICMFGYMIYRIVRVSWRKIVTL